MDFCAVSMGHCGSLCPYGSVRVPVALCVPPRVPNDSQQCRTPLFVAPSPCVAVPASLCHRLTVSPHPAVPPSPRCSVTTSRCRRPPSPALRVPPGAVLRGRSAVNLFPNGVHQDHDPPRTDTWGGQRSKVSQSPWQHLSHPAAILVTPSPWQPVTSPPAILVTPSPWQLFSHSSTNLFSPPSLSPWQHLKPLPQHCHHLGYSIAMATTHSTLCHLVFPC